QPPAIGDALELMLAAILEDEPGAGHEVLHGACCQHLSGLGKRSEPRADVYRDSAHSIAFQLHLARMHACTDLDAQVPDRTHDCKSAPHRPCRAIEGGEKAPPPGSRPNGPGGVRSRCPRTHEGERGGSAISRPPAQRAAQWTPRCR